MTPDYRLGCKRILISNDYYPALDRDDVDLVTDGIREITPTGIVTADGTEREVDCLIVATGFHTTDQPIAHHIKGSDGRSLADAWRESGMTAYKGTTVAGFPNLFQIVGPNTGLGHSSMVFVIESQIAYILGALRHDGRARARQRRAAGRRPGGVERGAAQADGAHGVEHRRLLELVPRRARPQHRAVAAEHLHVAPAAR